MAVNLLILESFAIWTSREFPKSSSPRSFLKKPVLPSSHLFSLALHYKQQEITRSHLQHLAWTFQPSVEFPHSPALPSACLQDCPAELSVLSSQNRLPPVCNDTFLISFWAFNSESFSIRIFVHYDLGILWSNLLSLLFLIFSFSESSLAALSTSLFLLPVCSRQSRLLLSRPSTSSQPLLIIRFQSHFLISGVCHSSSPLPGTKICVPFLLVFYCSREVPFYS